MENDLRCANCQVAIAPEYWNDPFGTGCRGCSEQVQVRVYPAMFRTNAAHAPDRIGAEGEASCFYHADNRAAVACEDCGRFLCSLCDLAIEGRHVCPDCLDRVRTLEASPVENQRVLYDSIALHLSTWPILTLWLPIVTAPAAIYFAIRHWSVPPLVLRRRWRLRMVLALVFACCQIAGILAFIGLVVWGIASSPK